MSTTPDQASVEAARAAITFEVACPHNVSESVRITKLAASIVLAALTASETRATRLEEALRAENTAMRATLDYAEDRLWEINPSNYDHDDACRLNDRSVEVILAIRHTLADLAKSAALSDQPTSKPEGA